MVEDFPMMLEVFVGTKTGNVDVINAFETEWQSLQQLIHEPSEGLSRVLDIEGHLDTLLQA